MATLIFRKTVLWIEKLYCSAVISTAVLLLIHINSATAQTQALPFITTWQTATRENPTARHIVFPGWGRNYSIFWTGRVGGRTVYGQLIGNGHTRIDFPAPGTYQVRVGPGNGTFYRFGIIESERTKLLSVDQWGSIVWSSMSAAFQKCYNMNVVAADIPNLSQVIDMNYMFNSCLALTGNASFNNWNTGNVRMMKGLFDGAQKFNQPISNWNTGNVTDMSRMFYYAYNFNQPIGNWNTSKVINMSNMFAYTGAFNQPIGNWNTSNVTNMSYMFEAAKDFNQPIGNWHTANVLDIRNMFCYTKAFNQPIGNWNTSKVRDMGSLFYFASAFNQPLANWDTGNVTNMTAMFCYNRVFNQPLENWNTQNVTSMNLMFSMTTSFNQPIGEWNTEKVTDMSYMFYGLPLFNQPLGNLNTAAVTNMSYMFHKARSFNQPLGNWQIGNVKSMNAMLDSTAISTDNYDQTLTNWERQIVQRGVVLGATKLTYCNGLTARNLIISQYGWVISGDRNNCSSCTGCRSGSAVTNPFQSVQNEISNLEIDIISGFAYPNPATERLFIKNESRSIKSLIITDVAGRTVLKQNLTGEGNTREEISTTTLSSGAYILTLFQKNGSALSQKILISK